MRMRTLTAMIFAGATLTLVLSIGNGTAPWTFASNAGVMVEEAGHIPADANLSDGGAFSICLGCK